MRDRPEARRDAPEAAAGWPVGARARWASVAAPTLTVLAGSAVSLLGTLAVRAVMARALTIETFGLLITAIAIATVAGGIANFGINPAAALRVGYALGKSAAEPRPAGAVRASRTALGFGVLSGLAAATFVYAAAPMIADIFADGADRQTLVRCLRVLTPVPLLMPIGGAALGIYRAHGRAAARALIRDGGGGVARAIGVGLAAFLGGGVAAIGLGYSAGVALAEGGFAIEVVRRGWLKAATKDQVIGIDRPLLRRLPPFGLLEVLGQGRMWIDLLVVSLLAPPAVVGIYGLARGLARGLEVVWSAGIHRYLPAIGSAAPEARATIAEDTRRFVLAVLLIPVAIGIMAPAVPVLILAGTPYLDSAPVLALLTLAILIDALFGYQDQSLLALGYSRWVAAIDTLGLLAYGTLLSLLVPRAGAIGAAWAMVVMTLLRATTAAVVLDRKTQTTSTLSLAGWPNRSRMVASLWLALGAWLARHRDLGGSMKSLGIDTVVPISIALVAGGLGIVTLVGWRSLPSRLRVRPRAK